MHARIRLLVVAGLLLSVAAAAPSARAAAPATPKKPSAGARASVIRDKAIADVDAQIAKAKVDKSDPMWRTKLAMPTAVTFTPGKTYFANVKTNKGLIVIQLMPAVAPMHVTNFIYLSRLGFYDGLTFHRVITNFMAQGGDPMGNGSGSPGYGFNGEFSPNVVFDKPGLLAMANTGQPNSDGSQFFITFVATPWLNGKHTIYGEVVQGMDVLKKLEAAGSQGGQTSEKLTMDQVGITVK